MGSPFVMMSIMASFTQSGEEGGIAYGKVKDVFGSVQSGEVLALFEHGADGAAAGGIFAILSEIISVPPVYKILPAYLITFFGAIQYSALTK